MPVENQSIWHVGDFCRILCNFDGHEHEGQIVSSDLQVFHVSVLGYGIRELKFSDEIHDSLGPNVRRLQMDRVEIEAIRIRYSEFQESYHRNIFCLFIDLKIVQY